MVPYFGLGEFSTCQSAKGIPPGRRLTRSGKPEQQVASASVSAAAPSVARPHYAVNLESVVECNAVWLTLRAPNVQGNRVREQNTADI